MAGPVPRLPGTLRLSWKNGRIFAVESGEEFSSGPYAHAYAWKKNSERRCLEIVSEPDAWIEELLADNPDNGVFSPYGSPVMARADALAQNPSWSEPTGRFFLANARREDSGTHPIFFKGTGEPFTPEEEAEVARRRDELREQMLGTPRSRHLFTDQEAPPPTGP